MATAQGPFRPPRNGMERNIGTHARPKRVPKKGSKK
jgi:hypothetical protein